MQAVPCVCFDRVLLGCILLRLALTACLLDGESWALRASCMTTIYALLASSERRLALVTDPVDAHPDGLLNSERFPVWLVREWFDGDGESLGQLLVPLCFDL